VIHRHRPQQRPIRSPPRAAEFLRDVLAGLASRPRTLPSRWLYDARGSRLFEWITRLPEYDLTRNELAILTAHLDALVAPFVGAPCTVVDLGAGDGHKTRVLLEALRTRCPAVAYAPLDLSRAALEVAARRVGAEVPGVAVKPVHADWGAGLRRVALRSGGGRKLVLFLGSSVGNLEHDAAARLLRDVRVVLSRGDHLLVGFDLLKPVAEHLAAYDDASGVTRAFNLNLLARMNRELGADFDLDGFRHVATFDPARPAMESWLESQRRQVVRVGEETFELEAGERIHTEISCKYDLAGIDALRRAAGFAAAGLFQDERRRFADALWRAEEEPA
jgi:dimethylhistidine N-methyltransferase